MPTDMEGQSILHRHGYVIGAVVVVTGLLAAWATVTFFGPQADGHGAASLRGERHPAHAAQSMIDQAAPRQPAGAVTRLSTVGDAVGAAAKARDVVQFNPLEHLQEHGGRTAVLSEMNAFGSPNPVFALKIQAPNIDVALSSLRQISEQLDPGDAQALDFAVRFLAVTRLRGADFTAYGEDPTAIPDSALFQHILPVIDGRTPMQVIVEARDEQVRLQAMQREIPVDPFDRIEMERQGKLPGMTIGR